MNIVELEFNQQTLKNLMQTLGPEALLIGGSLSAAAALAHLACIAIGARAYRFMGAGERIARAAEAGRLWAHLLTLAISCVLFTWAGYAYAGAGAIHRLPGLKPVLCAICIVYLGRALAFPLLKPAFPENSQTFWLVSSSACLVIGLFHGYGIFSLWSEL